MLSPDQTLPRVSGTTGLVLPGGGARGAYQAGTLKALVEIASAGGNPFQVIMGASVGAINAAALAASAGDIKKGADQLVGFWSKVTPESVFRTDLSTVLTTGAQWLAAMTPLGSLGLAHPRSLLDSTPLRELVAKSINFSAIDDCIAAGALTAIGVTVSSYDEARAVTFFQGAEGLSEWKRARRQGVRVKLGVEHVLASTALPLIFEAQRIGNEYFGDGSLRLTAPLSPPIHCGADRILVIGVRDANDPTGNDEGGRYPSLAALGGYLLDMVFMDNLDADIERARRIDRTLSLLPEDRRSQTNLRQVDVLVLQPSRDVREIAEEFAHEMPWTIKLLLGRFGFWGRNDWRLPSYLLFTPGYCKALIELGYKDTMARRDEIKAFLARGTSVSV